VYTYVVEVYTGELETAGTEADVHLMLVGSRGDTGRRKLLKSLGFADKKLQPGQVYSLVCATVAARRVAVTLLQFITTVWTPVVLAIINIL